MVEVDIGVLEFKADMEAYAKAAQRTYTTVLKRTIMHLSNGILKRSPHDKGKFMASNKISFDTVDDSVYEGPAIGKGAAKAIAKREQQKIKNLNKDIVDKLSIIWLSNSVPYNITIEYGLYPPGPKITGGYSKKAPKGVYRLAVQSTEEKIKNIIEEEETKTLNSLK